MLYQTVKLKFIATIEISSNGKEKLSAIGILHARSSNVKTQSQASGGTQLNVLLGWQHLVALRPYVPNCESQVVIHFPTENWQHGKSSLLESMQICLTSVLLFSLQTCRKLWSRLFRSCCGIYPPRHPYQIILQT